jgi:hypothetical protein
MKAPMALRLIDSPEPQRAHRDGASPLARLAPAAAVRLRAKDWAGFRAVVDEAGQIEDVHRRYEARRELLAAFRSGDGQRFGLTGEQLIDVAAAQVLKFPCRLPNL